MANYSRFGTFDYLKQVVTGGEGVLSPVQRMMCGLGAGMTEAALVVTWIETLKVTIDFIISIIKKIIETFTLMILF